MDECTDGWMDGQIDRHAHLVGSVSLENPNTLNYQRTMEAFPRRQVGITPPSAARLLFFFFLTWPHTTPSFRCICVAAHIHLNFLYNSPQINTSQSETASYFRAPILETQVKKPHSTREAQRSVLQTEVLADGLKS